MSIKLLLHVCCGPCSTYVAEVLSKNYEIIGYFYNPNIYPYEEWLKRYEAFRDVVASIASRFTDYFPKEPLTEEEWKAEHQKFLEAVRGFENEPEGGERCKICFRLRLEKSAEFTSSFSSPLHKGELGGVTFATTLTIGRNKKAEIINPIGRETAEKYGLKFYEADFKKQDGFLRSVKLSKKMGLYRQKYCGCEYSLIEAV